MVQVVDVKAPSVRLHHVAREAKGGRLGVLDVLAEAAEAHRHRHDDDGDESEDAPDPAQRQRGPHDERQEQQERGDDAEADEAHEWHARHIELRAISLRPWRADQPAGCGSPPMPPTLWQSTQMERAP